MAHAEARPEKSPADKLEGIAFSLCKAATVALFFGRYALPVAALLCAGFFLAAWFKGKRDSDCVLRYPLLISGFWIVVFLIWVLIRWNNWLPAWV